MNPYAAVLSPAAVASAPIPSLGDSIHETKSRYATPTRPPWSHPSRWALRPAANPPAPTASRFRPLSKASGASHAGVKATASPTDTANARERSEERRVGREGRVRGARHGILDEGRKWRGSRV